MSIARNSAFGVALLAALALGSGCATRLPYPTASCSELDAMPLRDGEPQIERGNPHAFLDGFGHYFMSTLIVPSKLLLLSWRVDNHRVSPQTEAALAQYLASNHLCHVKVRINQYAVPGEWSRLFRNRNIHWGWRYTLGVLTVATYTIYPQRAWGGDNYNPFTNTISIYSDLPAVALHEGGHAKDFAGRRRKGLYAALRVLPLMPLWQEVVASNDAVSYLRQRGDADAERRADPLLWAAYSSYLSGEALRWYSSSNPGLQLIVFPIAWASKAAGWLKSLTVPEPPPPAPPERAGCLEQAPLSCVEREESDPQDPEL